jgi:putative membrane protein
MTEQMPLAPSQVVTQLLAAERTFLAWVRTSIAIASLGFVVAKFGIWLRELAAQLNPQIQVQTTAMSLPIGIGLMIFGGLLTLAAAWHFRVVSQAIEHGRMHSNRALVTAVTLGVFLLSAVMIVYLVLASDGSASLRPEPT